MARPVVVDPRDHVWKRVRRAHGLVEGAGECRLRCVRVGDEREHGRRQRQFSVRQLLRDLQESHVEHQAQAHDGEAKQTGQTSAKSSLHLKSSSVTEEEFIFNSFAICKKKI